MGRRWILVGIVFLLLPWLLVGCGVAQEMYDAVAADLSKAQQALQSVQAELEAAQSQVLELTSSLEESKTKNSELTSSLEKAETELETTKARILEQTTSLEKSQSELRAMESEYNSFESEVKELWTSLDGYLELNHMVLGINAELLREDLDELYEGCSKLDAMLAASGDVELQTLWERAFIEDDEEWNLYFEPFYPFIETHASRISSRARAFRDMVAK